MNKYYLKRKAAGICYDCGKKAEYGKTRCRKCLLKIAERERIRCMDASYVSRKQEYRKKWVENNSEHVKEYRRKWYEENYKSEETRRAKDVLYDGKYMPLVEVSRRTGVPYSTLHKRVKYSGMSVGDAVMSYWKKGK
jgi:hypothetical protein